MTGKANFGRSLVFFLLLHWSSSSRCSSGSFFFPTWSCVVSWIFRTTCWNLRKSNMGMSSGSRWAERLSRSWSLAFRAKPDPAFRDESLANQPSFYSGVLRICLEVEFKRDDFGFKVELQTCLQERDGGNGFNKFYSCFLEKGGEDRCTSVVDEWPHEFYKP